MKNILRRFKRRWMEIFMAVFADGEDNDAQDGGNDSGAQPPADGGAPAGNKGTDPHPKPSGTVAFEELIAKARKEERDKLYPEIERQKKKVNDLLLVVAERDKTIEQLKADVQKLTKELEKANKALEEAQNKSGSTSAEASATIATLERTIEELKAKHQEEINKLSLELYKQQKLNEVGRDNLIPELVTGNTPEEIDRSIEASKQRLQQIRQSVLSGTYIPVANPNASTTTINLDKTPDEIARMSPKEYASWRQELVKAGVIK